jgi:elongation factor G
VRLFLVQLWFFSSICDIGTLSRQSSILNKTRNQRERVSKLMLLYASQSEEVDTLPFGSIGVILGLKHTRTGDTLVSIHEATKSSSLRDIIPPPAVMSASVTPQSHADLEPVQEALNSLIRTDPSVRVETQEGQMLVHALGALHLEIVEGRLRDEWGARFEFGKRRVSYREGLGSGPSSGSDTWSTEIAGKTAFVTVKLTIRPVGEDEKGDPVWDGNIIVDSTNEPLGSPDSFPEYHQPIAHVARGLANALSSSPHTSLAHCNIHIQVVEFSYPKEVTPAVLASATTSILRQHIRTIGMGPVMEPYVQLKVSVTEDALGKVVKDLTENGGEILDLVSGLGAPNQEGDDLEPYSEDGVYIPPEWLSPSSGPSRSSEWSLGSDFKRSVNAIAPLARMLDYSTRLRALSGGHSTFEMTTAGFRQVSEARKVEILKEIGRA